MVPGLRTKTRKSPSVQLDYIIHIQEIKPWPPSQSLRTLRAVLIQWAHGDKTSGLTDQVVPSLGTGTGVGDGRIEFNNSFKLSVTLMRDMSVKSGDRDTFHKNFIEFNLYEPRRDKTVKGQLLGTAILDFADYGVIKDNLSISAPINCKRTYSNSAQPLLYLKIQPVERVRSSYSSWNRLMREASVDRDHADSVSALMNEEYAEEAEVASFTTDDDVSSHSSLAVTSAAESNGSSSPQNKENITVAVSGSAAQAKFDQVEELNATKSVEEQVTESHVNSAGNSFRSSSMDVSSDLSWISKRISSQNLKSSAMEEMGKQQSSYLNSHEQRKFSESVNEDAKGGDRDVKVQLSSNGGLLNTYTHAATAELDLQADIHLGSIPNHQEKCENAPSTGPNDLLVAGRLDSTQNHFTDNENRDEHKKHSKGRRTIEEKRQQVEDQLSNGVCQDDVQKQVMLENSLISSSEENFAADGSLPNIDGSKHGISVRSSLNSSRSNVSLRSNQFFASGGNQQSTSSERKDAKVYPKETRSLLSDGRIKQLEQRIKALEGELREAAAIEVSLYSVVAEHGSSMTKVHAPARRLSRLYFHAIKQSSKSSRGSAAKSIVSGLILVAKSCGNDVPRLTFWLSNSVVLRVIMNKSLGGSLVPVSFGSIGGTMAVEGNGKKKPLSLKWQSFTKSTELVIEEILGDWENPSTFVAALEKVETWIFCRIIESIWWQTFTPHMQSGAAKAIRKSMDSDSSKPYRRTLSSTDQSLELWKKAFTDAYERICPLRAGGHECGCLRVLSRHIMEQLIARLDVAMFNAILRESADELPTDPVADPISDPEILPIPAGKASFGAGAQLKNAIGNWSRWLTDLFGIDDDDDLHEENSSEADGGGGGEQISRETSSKTFHLLNALSDLMMLPKDMLLSRTIRKEVCPTFGPPIIRRVLDSFIPDEFCPDPVPGVVLEALNSEDAFESEEDSMIMDFPCDAAAIVYQAPSPASVANLLGEIRSHAQLRRSGSSVLKKSQTSDDELDELDSPLKSIILDSPQSSSPSPVKPGWISKENGSRDSVRYQLLREVWMESE